MLHVIKIRDESVSENATVKLLGVEYDKHMRFSKHVANVVNKSKAAFHDIVMLKKAGVNTKSLGQFYVARVLSILTYAAPSWYPFISANDKGILEKYQRLCLRIILPEATSYEERLVALNLNELSVYLDICCLKYVARIKRNPDNPVYKHLPTTPDYHLHNRALSKPKCRSALLKKSLFFNYA